MITHLNGKLALKEPTLLTVECNGVGYSLNISTFTYDQLPTRDKNVFIFTVLIPREDSWNLYGFFTKDEREFFLLLTSVNGIGPKIALGILSSISSSDLKSYIATNNLAALVKLPGIGKKTAERLTLELKDKIIKLAGDDNNIRTSSNNLVQQEAASALATLGYSKKAAEQNVAKAAKALGDDATAEVLIKNALKFAMS